LLLSTERATETHDILLATLFEALATGPKRTEELVGYARGVWAGAPVTRIQVEGALAAALAGGLVETQRELGDLSSWALRPDGKMETELSRTYANDAYVRATRYLAMEAEKTFGHVTADECEAWTKLLLTVLTEGIRVAVSQPAGGIEILGGSALIPVGYDIDAMREHVRRLCAREEVSEFLQAMTVDALDGSHPFGGELVTNISMGYVLLSYLGRADLAKARDIAGSLRGEIAIIDTPVLLRIVGTARRARSVLEVIGIALQAGMRVLLHQETIDELNEVLDRRQATEVPTIEEDISTGTELSVLAAYVPDEALSAWLAALAAGEVASWSEFRAAVRTIPRTLASLGVEIVPIETAFDFNQAAFFNEFKTSLSAVIEERGRYRHDVPLKHDATMLLTAYTARMSNPSSASKIWPGAVIVTPDKNLNEAYKRVVDSQVLFPVAVPLSQWMGIVSSCSSPEALETIAGTMPDVLTYEALAHLASRFPLQAVRDIARAISAPDISSADVRATQLSLDELITSRPVLLDSEHSDVELVQSVLTQRHRRIAVAYERQKDFAEADRVAARVASEVAASKLNEEQQARQSAEQREATMGQDLLKEQSRRSHAETRAQRLPVVSGVAVLATLIAIVAALAGAWSVCVGAIVVFALWVTLGMAWANDRTQSGWLLAGSILVGALTVISVFR